MFLQNKKSSDVLDSLVKYEHFLTLTGIVGIAALLKTAHVYKQHAQ